MTKNISIDDVKKLAQLSQISISDTEAKSLASEMDAVLGYVQQLDNIDTDGLEPTSQVTGLKNANRDDVVVESAISREDLLENAPEQIAHQIKTRRIIQ